MNESANNDELTNMLESTLEDLGRSMERMEEIIKSLEAGEIDWEESVRLITEANDLAVSSSQKLDRVVQDVVYGSTPLAADDSGDRTREAQGAQGDKGDNEDKEDAQD